MKSNLKPEQLKVGLRVRTNGSNSNITNLFSGIITHISFDTFTVKRDDRKIGGGYENGWSIYINNVHPGYIITSEFLTYKEFNNQCYESCQ